MKCKLPASSVRHRPKFQLPVRPTGLTSKLSLCLQNLRSANNDEDEDDDHAAAFAAHKGLRGDSLSQVPKLMTRTSLQRPYAASLLAVFRALAGLASCCSPSTRLEMRLHVLPLCWASLAISGSLRPITCFNRQAPWSGTVFAASLAGQHCSGNGSTMIKLHITLNANIMKNVLHLLNALSFWLPCLSKSANRAFKT